MKIAILSVLLLTSGPVIAQDKFCIDASTREQYNARPISQHEVLARNAFGADHRAARLGTTCIHIYRESNVALHSLTKCIGLGDDLAVSTMGGRGEQCRVTSVTPVAESYADARYK